MRIRLSLLLVICWSLTIPAQANLIVNGSFEQTHVGANSWRWFQADDVTGWSGSNIEIWDRFQGFDAFDGFHHAELNAHGQRGQSFSIFQDFDTQVGSRYSVSFAYAARRSTNEAFSFDLYTDNFTPLMSNIIDDHLVRQWRVFENSFIATSTTTTIRFSTLQPFTGTVGNFIDDIKVYALAVGANAATNASVNTSQVDEPPVFALLALGVIFFVLRKKYN